MAVILENQTSFGNSKFEKAAAFVNIYVPTKDGQRRKLGALPLKNSVGLHKQIIGKINDEEAMQKLIQLLEFEFHEVSDETAELDI